MPPPISAAPNHRRWLLLPGQRAAARAAALALAKRAQRCLWVGTAPDPGLDAIPSTKARHWLGRELDLLVYDAWDGFDPDAFAALTGSLRGDGLLLWLIPELDAWPAYADPYLERVTSFPHRLQDQGQRFLGRLARLLETEPSLQRVEPQALALFHPPEAAPPAQTPFTPTPDQQQAIDALLRTATGRAHRPLVLSADRGRGKSSALGMAAARLLQQGPRRILVTAPRLEMVEALFQQARGELPGCQWHGPLLTSGQGELRFLPPDVLLRQAPVADLLLVDEAAALPGPLLERLLGAYGRIAFATTLHGYEGSGRGFVLRFTASLDRLTPGWRGLRLHTPIRWGLDDPLEGFLYRALLLDAEAPAFPHPASTADEGDGCEAVARDRLATDEPLLRQLFGLLLGAHYQTRPSDLRRLLDDPDLEIWLLRRHGALAAACLTLSEGGFDDELAQRIQMGERRPRGHLLAQGLTAHAGFTEAAGMRYRRVLRIAVHPELRRQGLGRYLLVRVAEAARGEGCDFIGSSFGATPKLLSFWYASGLRPLRIGMRRDAASGQHSVILLRALSPGGEHLSRCMQERFGAQLPYLLADPLRQLEPEIARLLFHPDQPRTPLNPLDQSDLWAFSQGRRDYAGARLALWRLTCLGAVQGQPDRWLIPLILKVLQGRTWSETALQLGLPGRKAVEQQLRACVAQLLRSLDE